MTKRVLLPIALAAISLAGCSGEEPAGTPAAASSLSAPPSQAASPSESPSASPSTSAKAGTSGAASAGCPVTAAVLEKAFKANARVAEALVLGKGLTDVSCYQGYATALTQPTDVDIAVVVFKYDAAKKTWAAVSGGTDGVCRTSVPAAIQPHLKGCQN